jgi:hypothetical protein
MTVKRQIVSVLLPSGQRMALKRDKKYIWPHSIGVRGSRQRGIQKFVGEHPNDILNIFSLS